MVLQHGTAEGSGWLNSDMNDSGSPDKENKNGCFNATALSNGFYFLFIGII